jgi:hypothetical protein
VHEHYDADGVLTGTTVVTREPEWDETSRKRAFDLHAYENGLCRCGCGRPAAESYDPNQVYRVDHFTCRAGRAIEIVRQQEAAQAKRDKLPDDWNYGRHYYAEPVKGGDDG